MWLISLQEYLKVIANFYLYIYKIIVSFESVGFLYKDQWHSKAIFLPPISYFIINLYKLLIVVLLALYPRYSTMASNNLEDEVTFIRRTSDRLREQGVEPRPIDPQYSTLRDKPSTTERAQSMTAQYSEEASGVRNGDHGYCEHILIESDTRGIETSAGSEINQGVQQSGSSQEEVQTQAAIDSHPQANARPPNMTPPRDQPNPSGLSRQNNLHKQNTLQSNTRPPIQVPPQKQIVEEMIQRNKDLKDQIQQAKLQREFEKLQEELHELKSPSPSTKTSRGIPTQGRQNSYMAPSQVPLISKARDLPRSKVASRPPPNDNGPSVEQGGLCDRNNYDQSVRSPIYCQPLQDDNRYNTACAFGGTPRTTSSQVYQLMRRDGELMIQIGHVKRDTEQLKLKLQHLEKIADDHNIQSDQDLYRLLENLVTWRERECFAKRYRPEERNYRTLKEFLMSGQERVSDILLPRTERGSMSSRELEDEISHWMAEFRSEGVLKKFVTIHLAPPHLKNRLREKLHLCESDFRTAWRVMLDTDEQEAKVRARNVNYHPMPRSNRSRPGRTQQQWRANNEEIICRNHQRYGANAYTCVDHRCTMRDQVLPPEQHRTMHYTAPHHAKNGLPNSPQ